MFRGQQGACANHYGNNTDSPFELLINVRLRAQIIASRDQGPSLPLLNTYNLYEHAQ